MNIAQIVAPDHMEKAREMFLRKLQSGGTTTYELDILTKDGRRRTLEISSRWIFLEEKPFGIQGIARDVTERKKAQEALRQSEVKFRTLVNAMDDIVFTLDR